MKKIILILFICLSILIGYQNCGNINLSQPGASLASLGGPHSYVSHFCMDSQYTSVLFLVTNLNAIPSQGSFLPDSDMDGVPDKGDPNSTISHFQGYIDIICSLTGTCPTPPNCTSTTPGYSVVQPGLTSCDLSLFGTASNIFDSNFNGIPDFIEVIRGANPLKIQPQNIVMDPVTTTINSGNGCDSDPRSIDYLIEVPELPTVSVKSYTAPADSSLTYTVPTGLPQAGKKIDFSHKINQNVIYTTIVLAEVGTSPVKYKGYVHVDYIGFEGSSNINLNTSDFIYIGEWHQ